MNFVIWAPPYSSYSGGVLALHRLAHNLCALGCNAYLASSKNPDWLGEVIEHHILLSGQLPPDPIVIYPEIVSGNPYHSPRIVRWLLNTPGVIGGDGVYSDTDLVMTWSHRYVDGKPWNVRGVLKSFREFSHFRDLHQERSGVCYAVRKGGSRTPYDQHPPDALCIDDYFHRGDDEYLIQVFNSHKQFVCYDTATMLPLLAALCGCLAVIVPNGTQTREDLEAIGEDFTGVAWGFDDIPRAIATMPDARDLVDSLIRSSVEQVASFIELCHEQWPELKNSL